MTVSGDRAKALEAALAQVNKKHGADAAMLLGDKPAMKVEVISTGSLALDIALGVGGLPKGRIIEIYGPESSGKTLLCLHAIRSVQESGGLACFIDAEHALDPSWAKKVGVDTDNLIISQPGSGEEALDITETMIRSGAIDLIVVDSVAALTPKKEIDGEIGDSMVGLQARMLSQAMRKLVAATNQTKTTVIFINQLREKIGVMFGSPETTTGGKALKFYASQRLDIRRIETLKVGADPVGARTRVKVIKNKVAPPFKQAEFDILFTAGNEGFSREGDIIDIGVELNLIKKSGAWFTLAEDGSQLGQGKEKARLFLRENKELAQKLEAEIRAQKLAKPEEISDGNPLDDVVPEDLLDD